MKFIKCMHCDKVEEFEDGTISWCCSDCHEEFYQDRCEMCNEKKPNDKGMSVAAAFWICDTCANKDYETA